MNTLNKSPLTTHIIAMITLGIKCVAKYGKTYAAAQEIGTTNTKGDETIGMDIELEQVFIEYVKEHLPTASIFSEEIGSVNTKAPEYLVVFDPLDGSTNFKVGKGLFPHGFLITIYKGEKPNIGDVIVSGMYECIHDQGYIFDGVKTFQFSASESEVVLPEWKVHPKTPIQIDLWWKESFHRFGLLSGHLWVRDSGSQIGNLLAVLAGAAAMTAGAFAGPEEIGAIYSLVKGAGGVAVDMNTGDDIGILAFDADRRYPILAGAENVVSFALGRMYSQNI